MSEKRVVVIFYLKYSNEISNKNLVYLLQSKINFENKQKL